MPRKIKYTILFTFLSVCSFSQVKTTQSNADQQLKYKVSLLDLGTNGCEPCKKMKPILEKLKAQYSDRVNIQIINVYTKDGEELAIKYNIDGLPTQIFLDSLGKEYFRHKGFLEEDEIINKFRLKGVK